MSGFWTSDLGEVTGNAADAFAKSFTQIPDGTMALARIEGVLNAEHMGKRYLVIDWVLTGGDFKGQKVSQKLKVWDEPKVRHRALNMLKLMYQLYNIKPKHAGDPTDQDLLVFVGKEAGIKIRETEPNDDGRQYNWVAEIHESRGFVCETGTGLVIKHTVKSNGVDSALNRQNSLFDSPVSIVDDIPF